MANEHFVDKSGGFGSADIGYRMSFHDPSLSGRAEIADGTNEASKIAESQSDLTVQTLFSIASTRDDSAPELEVFRNAVPTGAPSTVATGDLTNALVLTLGNRTGGNNWLDGQIIAYAMWRRLLTNGEISEAHDLLTGGTIQLRGSIPIPGL